jgi:hypothetical protein
MKPKIKGTGFGWIDIGDTHYDHDVIIHLDGSVTKRKKKLSSEVYGTSHTISRAEAEFVYDQGAELLLVGTGQEGLVRLSEEAAAYFEGAGVRVELLETPKVAERWNGLHGKVIALLHVTC